MCVSVLRVSTFLCVCTKCNKVYSLTMSHLALITRRLKRHLALSRWLRSTLAYMRAHTTALIHTSEWTVSQFFFLVTRPQALNHQTGRRRDCDDVRAELGMLFPNWIYCNLNTSTDLQSTRKNKCFVQNWTTKIFFSSWSCWHWCFLFSLYIALLSSCLVFVYFYCFILRLSCFAWAILLTFVTNSTTIISHDYSQTYWQCF